MNEDIVTYIRSCERCCQKKSPPTPKRANFGKMPVPSAPWQWIGMDIAGPFPRTDRGSRYILVVTCAFSKWVETFALPNQEASTIASVLVDQLFSRYGCPSVIHSDQGRNFEANLMKDIFSHLGIKKTRTSGYHPQGNGLVERFNKTVCSMLSMFVAEDQRDWDAFLPKVTFAYNTSVHDSTKEMPFTLFMGRRPRLPADVACETEACPASLLLSEAQKEDLYQKVSTAISAAATRRAERQAQRANVVTYQVGDFVWLHNPARKVGRSPKLHRPWEGPYQVTAVLSECTCRIQWSQSGSRRRSMVVHHDRLKPCVCREEERYNEIRDAGLQGNDGSARSSDVPPDEPSRDREGEKVGKRQLDESQDSGDELAFVGDQSEEVGQQNVVESELEDSQGAGRALERATVDSTPDLRLGDDRLGGTGDRQSVQPDDDVAEAVLERSRDETLAQDLTTGDPTNSVGIDGGLRRSTRDKRPVQRYGEWEYDI